MQNILVLENHNHIGDTLCSLTLFAALKKKFHASYITLVATKTSYPIPLLEINPYINEVLTLDSSSIKAKLQLLRKLRRRKYQIGIVPSTKAVSRTLHILNFLSGAKFRIGVKSIDEKINSSHKLLNVKGDFCWKDKHQLERNLEVARQIGCDLTKDEFASIKFNFSSEELSFAKKYLTESFPDKAKKVIAFHPGAGKIANSWKKKNFIELITNLFTEFHIHVLITKGPVDSLIINAITKSLIESGIRHLVLFDHNIKNVGAILSMVDLFITNDTGTMHIAGFSGARMISLFGPTNPREWAPRDENQFYIKARSDNINDISVQEVFDFAKKMLNP